jgi:two-component system cell cycle sensor histidine kinase/response regulator CckA
MGRKPRVTILLVDDDPLIRSLGRELLEKLGYRVAAAGDAYEALEFYRRLGGADLVILDYYLPDRDGCHILQELKALDGEVRVLMASGFFPAREAARLRKEGALGFINKPYRVAELESRIEEALRGCRPGPPVVRTGKARPLPG